MELCTFRLAGRLFGTEIGLVKEVVEHVNVAEVPHAPTDVSGIVNIRGKLHLVVDLRRLFGFAPAETRSDVRLVLFKNAVGESLGVQVDSLGDVISIDPRSIEDRRAGEAVDGAGQHDERRKARQGVALGVARTANGLMVLLAPSGILPAMREQTADEFRR